MRDELIVILKEHGVADFDGYLVQCACGLWIDKIQWHQADLILQAGFKK